MKKILCILLVLVCIFSLCSLTLGTTIDGLFTGTNNTSSADDYGQFLDSFGVILGWFDGLGNFFRSTLDFVRGVGIALAEAWEAVEGWFADVGSAIIETIENVMEFFGWVNEEKPSDDPTSYRKVVNINA